jgi:hypothetical protein
LRTHFLHSGHLKKLFGRSCEIGVSSRRMTLGNYNLLSGRLKTRIWEVDKAMTECVQRPCEFVFCILCVQKKKLGRIRGSDISRR